MFRNVSKVVLCGTRNTFALFSKDALQFSWQAQHFGRVHLHFAWQAFENRIVRAASSGDNVQIPWQAWNFVRCAEKTEASHETSILSGIANFEVHKKTREKTLILKLQSVKIGGCLARNARFDAPRCLVSSLWFSCGLAVSMGEAAKSILFQGVKASCNVVLRGRRGSLRHSHMSANLSNVISSRRRSTFAYSTLYSPHTPHTTLHTPHTTLPTLHFALHTSHSTCYTCLHLTLHTLHSTLCTLHFTLHTLHFTHYTLHSTLYT